VSTHDLQPQFRSSSQEAHLSFRDVKEISNCRQTLDSILLRSFCPANNCPRPDDGPNSAGEPSSSLPAEIFTYIQLSVCASCGSVMDVRHVEVSVAGESHGYCRLCYDKEIRLNGLEGDAV
jgi:hypothetical protein